MDVSYANTKLAKLCTSVREMQRQLGAERARRLQARLQQLKIADNLHELRTQAGRCHELTGDLDGLLALDLDHPYRLLIAPDPWQERPDGSLAWEQVTAVVVDSIDDYH
ncbi:hypothetical protein ASE16_02010 [Leifsonia sp. Root227]|uniref:hypothetical protein n=1 Tax=Leifsonia sp. Root227 TaxID=1736496 RepID=UPI0006F312B1|nr:hypothetical protein [Leifsonia sp. Root227]KRC51867.1 hypothetical protein ASE16_02010 [Leifsonia sp. Root227]